MVKVQERKRRGTSPRRLLWNPVKREMVFAGKFKKKTNLNIFPLSI
jgi:hypothetical protein